MDYKQFKNSVLHLPLILSKDLERGQSNKQIIRNQLRRWQDNGLIFKLKRGMYLLNVNDRKINPSRQFIANQLYMPSYVSLEYALNFYDLIPERVSEVTSVTTKKTIRFVNDLGTFTYQHIKSKAFRGFKMTKDEMGLTFFIAEPEKAVIDFLYLNFDKSKHLDKVLDKIKISDKDVFESSYRFQNTETLSQRRIMELAGLFESEKLTRFAQLFCEFIGSSGN